MSNSKPARDKPPSAKFDNKQSDFERSMYQRNLFLSMAFNMSWQLAVVVIVPIVGGYKLDEYLGISYLWTIIGSIIAVLGVFVVLRHVVAEAERRAYSRSEGDK
jgi:F0F1-type ATP synthase assembly protein I